MKGVRDIFGDERVPVEAVKAGVDMLLMPPDLDLAYNAVLEAVRSGGISEARIDESVDRIIELKMKRGLFEKARVDASAVANVVGIASHLEIAHEVTNHTVTLVKNDSGSPATGGAA